MTANRLPIIAITILSVLIALPSYRFLALGLPMSFPDMPGHIEQRWLAFVLHVSFAPIALIIGAVQFFPKMRTKRPTLHRWLGRIYGVAVLISGLAGLIVAMGAEGGPVAQVGFGALSLLWLLFTANAVRLAIAREITRHRRWMIRSFALTFAGVTLRLYLIGFLVSGFSYTEASVYLAWLCWVPNLIFMEWWMRKST